MYRVLHIMAGADAGGISTVVLNYYRFLDRDKIHFDVALTGMQDGQNGRLLRELGANIYHLPMKSKGLSTFSRAMTLLLREGAYDAVHVHENETSYVALAVAKQAGIRHRFAHSHTSSPHTSWKSELKRLSGCMLNYHYATRVIACGQLAGQRVFGKINMKRKKALILPNAIDAERFSFDDTVRCQMRRQMGLETSFVIGMVGRLAPEKNHLWALDMMERLREKRCDAVLLIVGNGPEEERLREAVERRDMEAYVSFLGRRDDVARLCQAFDVLILPSVHEGFPVAAVEAMASGLPVLLSDTVTRELSFGAGVQYLSLDDHDRWVKTLSELSVADRHDGTDELKAHGLDLRSSARVLEELYLNEK